MKKPIWAPWRIKYILDEKKSDCIFCSKLQDNQDTKNFVIYRAKHSFIIMNIYPYNCGHLMIAPYSHERSLNKLDNVVLLEIMQLASKAEVIISKVMSAQGFNLGFNIGKAAGAGIEDHLHLHVVPRWEGDNNFMPVLDDIHVVPQALEETYELLVSQNWDLM